MVRTFGSISSFGGCVRARAAAGVAGGAAGAAGARCFVAGAF